MPRTAAKVTQADIARAIRAAQSVSERLAVEVAPDGTIRICADTETGGPVLPRKTETIRL